MLQYLSLSSNSLHIPPHLGPEHLENYHEWMQDPSLLEATGSEPLSMEEEIAMQREWRDDEKKCTFIILARDLINYSDESSEMIPPPPLTETMIGDGETQTTTYPQLVEQTLDAMIGDVNLFLSEEEEEYNSDDEQLNQQQQYTDQSATTELLSQAELDLMIAAKSHQNKKMGTELALMMMHYGAKHLKIRRFFVKINEDNHASLKLFKEKIGFVQCDYAECFQQYELECKCESSEEMVEWIEKRWEWWCQQQEGGDANEDKECGFRLCCVYSCPLGASS